MRLSDKRKQELVARYHGGESLSEIYLQSGAPRSTFYMWLKPYQINGIVIFDFISSM